MRRSTRSVSTPARLRALRRALRGSRHRAPVDAALPLDRRRRAVEDREAATRRRWSALIAARPPRPVDLQPRTRPGPARPRRGPRCARRFAIAGRGAARAPDAGPARRSAAAPLLALAQRLPSAFLFRAIEDPVDRDYPSAFVVNDAGGYYFRPLGNRFEGEPTARARARTASCWSTSSRSGNVRARARIPRARHLTAADGACRTRPAPVDAACGNAVRPMNSDPFARLLH